MLIFKVPEDGGKMSEDRCQRTDVRRQRTDGRGQRADVRRLKTGDHGLVEEKGSSVKVSGKRRLTGLLLL